MTVAERTEFQLYDTTLRDGVQQRGLALSVRDKLEICRLLDGFGVDFIEGGWPGAVPRDTEFFRRAAAELDLGHARLAAFGATRRPDAQAGRDTQVQALLRAETEVVTLVAKSHDRHVRLALRTTLEENLAMVRDTVHHLVSLGRRVFVDAEHFFEGFAVNPDYSLAVARTAVEAGAEKIVLCDTNGGTLPSRVAEVVGRMVGLGLPVGIHCHDDAGCAVANSLLAVEAGAGHIQGTANGYGERCGNANLFTVVADLVLKQGVPAISEQRLRAMATTARAIADLAGAPIAASAPYVGSAAFSHKGGLHASALRVDAPLYQHVEPERVGNGMRVLVSELGGRSSVVLKARELGYRFDQADLRVARIAEDVKQLELDGYAFDSADASFELLLRRRLAQVPDEWPHEGVAAHEPALRRGYEIGSWRVHTVGAVGCPVAHYEAVVQVAVEGREVQQVGAGGEVASTLFAALRAALGPVYPAVAGLRLVGQEVRMVSDSRGAPVARALVRFEDAAGAWGVVGVHRDPAAATLAALCDALDHALLGELGVEVPQDARVPAELAAA